MKCLRIAALCLLATLSLSLQAAEEGQRPHAYAFDDPSLLVTQRTFGIGNAVTLLGDACVNDPAATASYEQWRSANLETLRNMTARLVQHYRIRATADEQQQRVAEAMHLKTQLSLSETDLEEACASLPETLALPWMNLAQRYQVMLTEMQDPNYLKPQMPKKADDREEQTRSE